MKNFWIKYLVLSTILLAGYGRLYAKDTQPKVGFQTLVTEDVTYNSSKLPVSDGKNFVLNAFNVEKEPECKSLRSKKKIKFIDLFVNKSIVPCNTFTINYIQKTSFFKNHSFLRSCKRFILLRVLRI